MFLMVCTSAAANAIDPSLEQVKTETQTEESGNRILRFGHPRSLVYLNNLFLQQHPDVRFEYVQYDEFIEYVPQDNPIEEFFCDDPEVAIDIYILSVTEGLPRLIREGYVQDLSASEIISDAFASYFPQVRDVLSSNGNPMAVPYSFGIGVWDYDKESWDALELPEVPRSAEEMVRLINRWNQDVFLPPETILYGSGGWDDIRIEMLMDVLRMYVAQYGVNGIPLDFDTPGFRDVITQILALPELPYSNYMQFPLLLCDDDLYPKMLTLQDIDSKEAIIAQQSIDDKKPFSFEGTLLTPVGFLEGDPARVGAEVEVVCIASNTRNPELAMEYIEYILDHQTEMQEDLYAMLTVDFSEMDILGIQKETQLLYCDLVPGISLHIDSIGKFRSMNIDGDKYHAIFLDAYDLFPYIEDRIDNGDNWGDVFNDATSILLTLMEEDIDPLIRELNECSLYFFNAHY